MTNQRTLRATPSPGGRVFRQNKSPALGGADLHWRLGVSPLHQRCDAISMATPMAVTS